MFFVYNPHQPSPAYFNPEDAYSAFRRREYIAALEEEQRRIQFQRELALEEERHRQALAAIAQQEAARRLSHTPQRFAPRRPQQHASGACVCGHNAEACTQPDPQELYRRRQARQREEERLSREFHKNILTDIFGVPSEQIAHSAPQESPVAPLSSILAEGKLSPKPQSKEAPPASKETSAGGSTIQYSPHEEPEAHWSAAPDRARSLAEITSISRAFTSLKNTFVFPSGPLERIPGSNPPRLGYNNTNASIHAYQHALSELLSKLDGVVSHGFKGLREARKQLVVKIEEEMDQLERKIMENLALPSGPEAETIPPQEKPVETESVEMPTAAIPLDAPPTDNVPAKDDDAASMETDTKAPQNERDDIEMKDVVDSTSAEANKALPGDGVYPEKSVVPSVPEVVASTEVEPLEPQVTNKDSVGEETQALSDPSLISATQAPIPSHPVSPPPKTFTISVEDDDSEVDDAVKTCSLA